MASILSTIAAWPGQIAAAASSLGRRMGTAMAGVVGIQTKPVWPPVAHEKRLRQYEAFQRLYEGNQRKYFESIGFKQASPARPYICVNLLGGVTDLLATRSYGEGLEVAAPSDDKDTQAFLDAVTQENRFLMLAYDQCRSGYYKGDRAYKVTYDADAKKLSIQALAPNIVFPEWDPLDGAKLTAANIDQLLVEGDRYYLWRERHELREGESWVVNRLYRLSTEGNSDADRTYYLDESEDEVPLDALDVTAALVPEAATGIDALLVVYQQGTTRYTDALLSLQGEYNQLVTQKSHLFDKHLPAIMAGPVPADDQKDSAGNVDPDRLRYFAVNQGETMPVSLLEWSAQGFDAADEHLRGVLTGFAFTAGVDVAALVPDASQAAASGTALRRQQMKTQGTVAGLQRYDEPTLQEVLSVCTKLGAAQPLAEGVSVPQPLERHEITITFQDGLPADRTEEVNEHVQLVTAGIESRQDANKALFGGTDEDAAERIAEADAEAQANRPPSPFAGLTATPDANGGRFTPVTPTAGG